MEENNISPEDILNLLENEYDESIFITDKNANIVFVNKVAASRLGVTKEEITGRNVHELMAEGLYSRSTVLKAMQSGKTEVAALYPEQNNSVVSQSKPIFDRRGNLKAVITINMSHEHSKV